MCEGELDASFVQFVVCNCVDKGTVGCQAGMSQWAILSGARMCVQARRFVAQCCTVCGQWPVVAVAQLLVRGVAPLC